MSPGLTDAQQMNSQFICKPQSHTFKRFLPLVHKASRILDVVGKQ